MMFKLNKADYKNKKDGASYEDVNGTNRVHLILPGFGFIKVNSFEAILITLVKWVSKKRFWINHNQNLNLTLQNLFHLLYAKV